MRASVACLYSLLIVLGSTSGVAQTTNASVQIPLDTTYTVASTYNKLIKQYPDIKPVKPAPSAAVKEFSNVVYRSLENTPFGKRVLHVDVFKPAQKKGKFPALILVHGGGWRSGDKSMNTPMAQRLAANGFVVVSVEYRLSLEAKYPAAVHDLKAVIRWTRKNAKTYNIDPDHIAIGGCSAGGQLASLVGATNDIDKFDESPKDKYSSAVQAVVDMDGLLDFTDPETLAVKRNENSADIFWLQGSYEEIPERWKEASALNWVSTNTPPFLFINSSQTRFHAGCTNMAAQLNQYKIYNEVQTLEGSPHSYWLFHPWFDPTVQYITNFLNNVFKPVSK